MIAPKTEMLAKYVVGILLFVAPILMPVEECVGYIIPAEQLIAFMAKNFSKFRTLVIVQSTQQRDEKQEGEEESFMERIWVKSPDLCGFQVLDHPIGRIAEPDLNYRQLLMANEAQRLAQLLSSMGVNLHSVAFTRMDDVIAYRIGDREPEQPKILVDKNRFLPLLLVYRPLGRSVLETITVQFKDYKKMDEGWYPFQITYSDGKGLQEDYTIHTLQANVPIDPAVFIKPKKESLPDQASEPGQVPPEEERLRGIIKKFEEKYQ